MCVLLRLGGKRQDGFLLSLLSLESPSVGEAYHVVWTLKQSYGESTRQGTEASCRMNHHPDHRSSVKSLDDTALPDLGVASAETLGARLTGLCCFQIADPHKP